MSTGDLAVIEELLETPFRGRGFAPAMQRMFLERLADKDDRLVWGTIDARNIPSLRTAQRVGREIVFGNMFFPIEG